VRDGCCCFETGNSRRLQCACVFNFPVENLFSMADAMPQELCSAKGVKADFLLDSQWFCADATIFLEPERKRRAV
jgi:hypothetical protein